MTTSNRLHFGIICFPKQKCKKLTEKEVRAGVLPHICIEQSPYICQSRAVNCLLVLHVGDRSLNIRLQTTTI